MPFVNEKLTEKDKKFIASFKFHNPIGRLNELASLPEEWSIDKDNNYFLICLGGQGELDKEYPPNYYKLIINTEVVDIKARYKTEGNGITGIKITWEIESIVADARKTDADIKQIVMSAFESYGNIHFGGHIIKTEFDSIAEPFYLR
ncbi:MAG: hypothetical protein IJX24_05120 [Oscillospiraceae bacterium]|nr:hypothetical protein [Oscillospiraceae bacterium]